MLHTLGCCLELTLKIIYWIYFYANDQIANFAQNHLAVVQEWVSIKNELSCIEITLEFSFYRSMKEEAGVTKV